jgi:cell fate (sporulation/competence/biofilm development) regulator YlbF (YheA/YmcA/DUF963 family)
MDNKSLFEESRIKELLEQVPDEKERVLLETSLRQLMEDFNKLILEPLEQYINKNTKNNIK